MNQVGQIMIWNLISLKCKSHKRPRLTQLVGVSVSFPDPILQLELNDTCPWLVVAFKTGLVRLMDCKSTRMSPYIIPIDIGNGSKLKAIHLNPTDFNLLLMGFENECIVWNFEQKRPVERFIFNFKNSSQLGVPLFLNCVGWHPNGSELATGYSNGSLALWTVKKTMLQNLTKSSKRTHLQVYQTGVSVENVLWVSNGNPSSSTTLYASHSTPKVSRFEFVGEKYDKASCFDMECIDIVESLVHVLLNNVHILFTLGVHENLQVHYQPQETDHDIPASMLHYMNGKHSSSSCSDEGFLFVSAVKQTRQKKPVLVKGGSLLPNNTTRNYHVMALLRNRKIEFWHMSIPYPSFLSSLSISPDLEDLNNDCCKIELKLHDRIMSISTETKLVFCEFIHQNGDIDDMFKALDETMDAINQDSKIVKKLTQTKRSNENVEKKDGSDEEEDIPLQSIPLTATDQQDQQPDLVLPLQKDKEQIDLQMTPLSATSPVKGDDVLEPIMSARTSSLSKLQAPGEIQFKGTPPMYIADAQWAVSFELHLSVPVTSFEYCPALRVVAASTDKKVYVFQVPGGALLLETDLLAYYTSFKNPSLAGNTCISYVGFKLISNARCLLIITTQSLFVFQIVGEKVSPFFAFHCDDDFGVVLDCAGLSRSSTLVSANDNYDQLLITTTSAVLLFEISDHGLVQSCRRDFKEMPIIQSGTSIMDGTFVEWFKI